MEDSVVPVRLSRVVGTSPSALDELSRRDVAALLLDIYSLHLAPLELVDDIVEWQHDPRVAATKRQLEARFRATLDDEAARESCDDAVQGMRRLAHDDMVPRLYDWLAERAGREELTEYLAVEGGPDADFDDLVAICQIGLVGLPKLTLAANYWDEMGRGSGAAVHTALHRQMAESLALVPVPLDDLPLEALERRVLNGYLATNRALQPEMIGGLGLIECQAGPRCRRIVQAMRRLGVPAGAVPFYEEHATADPRHGKDWIDGAVAPLVARHPSWGPRIVRGAAWRAAVNRRFFAAMSARFDPSEARAA